MAEYIKREALEKDLNIRLSALRGKNGYYDHYTDGFDECVDRVENFPAADVEEVKHGKWIQEQIKIENMSIVRYRNTCSECGGKADFLLRELHYSYCPHCGAKMDLED